MSRNPRGPSLFFEELPPSAPQRKTPGKGLITLSSTALVLLSAASAIVLVAGPLVSRYTEAANAGQSLVKLSAFIALVANALPIVLELLAGLLGLGLSGRLRAAGVLKVLGLLTLFSCAVPFLASLLDDGFLLRDCWHLLIGIAASLFYLLGARLNRGAAQKQLSGR